MNKLTKIVPYPLQHLQQCRKFLCINNELLQIV